VFGVNLNGDYSSTVGGPYYLTAGPFDFSDYTNVMLHFKRWLNTEYGSIVPSTLAVSSNGTSWSQLYLNVNFVTSTNWTSCQYDLSGVADRQAAVYLRWGYQVKAGADLYSGWNIDDIGFSGEALASAYTVTFDAQGGTEASPASMTVTNGATYGTLATTTRDGYTFEGWWTGAGGTGSQVTSSTPVTLTSDQTLYAQWSVAYTSQGTSCSWLDQYGLVTGTNYEAAALTDTDDDGFAAWQEYIAGTSPTNASSFFGITNAASGADGFVVGWNAVSGRVYAVYGATNLLNSFQSLETNIFWPQSSWTDTVENAESGRFYQLNVQLAP
jgi:uncharacterized repeat protein (TIGR02543 family)